MQFEITFKNEKEKIYYLFGYFLVALHALFFIYLLFNETFWKGGLAGLVIISLYSVYQFLACRSSGQKFYYGGRIFFLFGIFISVFVTWWVWVIEIILSALNTLLIQKRSIYINPFIIEYRAHPSKRYKWSEFNNVIVKDNILTLDFKNNKLVQGEINTPVNEKEFNAFVNEQLIKHN